MKNDKKSCGPKFYLHVDIIPLHSICVLSHTFEISVSYHTVAFSLQTADPIITKIDPENYVMYRLYRDATHFMNGCHKKVK